MPVFITLFVKPCREWALRDGAVHLTVCLYVA